MKICTWEQDKDKWWYKIWYPFIHRRCITVMEAEVSSFVPILLLVRYNFSCDLDVIFIGDWYYLCRVRGLEWLFSIKWCNYHLVDCAWSTIGSGRGLFGSIDCRNDRWSDGICRCIAIRGPKGQLVLRLLVPMQGDDNKQLGTFRSCCFQDITLSQIYQV